MQPQQPTASPEQGSVPGPRAQPKIFISYRRSDSAAITYRVFERLAERFGRESIFIDIDNIPYGTDFRAHIRKVLAECDVLLLIIGQRWIGSREGTPSRIHDDDDPVRLETLTAMQGGTRLIPVLVEGATMPRAEDLPEHMKELPYLNAAMLDVGRNFQHDMDRLIASIGGGPVGSPVRPRSPAGGMFSTLTGGLGIAALAAGAAAIAVPIAGQRAALSPPWPPGIVYLTVAILVLAIAAAFAWLRSRTPAVLTRLLMTAGVVLAVAGTAYLIALSSLTYQTPTTKERWAKGYRCTPEAQLVYKDRCPRLGLDELRGAEYEAERLWTAGSVAVVRMTLVGLWLVSFVALGILIGGLLTAFSAPAAPPRP